MPRSSEAFIYFTAYFYLSPRSMRAIHSTVEVLPTPGGPARIRCGKLPILTTELTISNTGLETVDDLLIPKDFIKYLWSVLLQPNFLSHLY
jgi:hypothetical protein